jgi:hypothetical protein
VTYTPRSKRQRAGSANNLVTLTDHMAFCMFNLEQRWWLRQDKKSKVGFPGHGVFLKSKTRVDKAKVLFPNGLPASKLIQFDAGETIFSQGDECMAVHYVKEGVVKLTLVSKGGRAAVLGFLGRGDFFGETCISSQAFYSTSAVTLVPGSVLLIDRKKMLKMREDEPTLCSQFINYLLARNHRIEQDLIDHLFNSSETLFCCSLNTRQITPTFQSCRESIKTLWPR